MRKYIALKTSVHHRIVLGSKQSGGSSLSAVSLPKITIPKFDGDGIQKMWYLKTNVSGEAENLISHLSLTEDNYATAWKIMQDRYNNRRVISSVLIQKIIGQPNLSADIFVLG